MLDQVREREARLRAAQARIAAIAADDQAEIYAAFQQREALIPLDDQMRTYAEGFYYFAFRIVTISKAKQPALLPEIGEVDSSGVRTVRNKLLEHFYPDGRLAVADHWAHGGDQGPVLAAFATAGVDMSDSDQGLYVNAEQFRENFEGRILRAIQALQ